LLDTAAKFEDPLAGKPGGMRTSPKEMRGFLQGLADKGLTWDDLKPKQQHMLKMGFDVYNRERAVALSRGK
jgi:hypothetical protein